MLAPRTLKPASMPEASSRTVRVACAYWPCHTPPVTEGAPQHDCLPSPVTGSANYPDKDHSLFVDALRTVLVFLSCAISRERSRGREQDFSRERSLDRPVPSSAPSLDPPPPLTTTHIHARRRDPSSLSQTEASQLPSIGTTSYVTALLSGSEVPQVAARIAAPPRTGSSCQIRTR
jgi:hypothetical protein